MNNTLVSVFFILSLSASAQVKIEYIAHASFILESPGGSRIAIDPYSGKHSLGYYYPDNMEADVVAITHPHFDHDASYYFGTRTPVLTDPGNYAINDLSIQGIKAEHGGGERFRKRGAVPYNTIWRIEIDGMSMVHLGDNGLLTDEMLTTIGDIDILMIQVFEEHHTYTSEEFKRVIDALNPSIVLPMHYRVTEISDIPSWTGNVDSWIEKQPNASKNDTNVLIVTKENLKEKTRIIKLRHSPKVKPWSTAMKASWSEFADIRGEFYNGEKDFKTLNERTSKIIEQSPEVLIYYNLKAQLMDSLGQNDLASHLLEEGLTNSGLDDWEQQIIARGKLAHLYLENGLDKLAEEQYRWIVSQNRTYQQAIKDKASAYLEKLK